jgi:indole-3-glycerol phosphate synthase
LSLLDRIVATKRQEVAELRLRTAELKALAERAVPARDFAAALQTEGVALIAEVKRRSPSAGSIHEALDPVATAVSYVEAGARAVSVLTDATYFGGSLADLRAVSSSVSVPVLRKDFTIDELQIVEARGAGAAAVLLIVRLLAAQEVRRLREVAESLGMQALVEAHNGAELEIAVESGARLIGINNRDLDTLQMDLTASERLIPRIPAGCIAVAESGIRSAADAGRMAAAGADALLAGESLLRHGAPAAAAASLTGLARVAVRTA